MKEGGRAEQGEREEERKETEGRGGGKKKGKKMEANIIRKREERGSKRES